MTPDKTSYALAFMKWAKKTLSPEAYVDLVQQHLRIDYNTVADKADLLRVEDASGHKVQGELALVVDDGVPGVVSRRVASNDVGILGEEVDHAALFAAGFKPGPMLFKYAFQLFSGYGFSHCSFPQFRSGNRAIAESW